MSNEHRTPVADSVTKTKHQLRASAVDCVRNPAIDNNLSLMRDYALRRQRLYLDVDLENETIKGKAEVFIVPQSRALTTKQIRLNSRQTNISQVLVDGTECRFQQLDVLGQVRAALRVRATAVGRGRQTAFVG